MRYLTASFIAFFFLSCSYNKFEAPGSNHISYKNAKADFALANELLQSVHPDLYRHVSAERYQQVYDSIDKTITQSLTERELLNKINILTMLAGCSHTDTDLGVTTVERMERNKVYFPYPLIHIDGKLFLNTAMANIPVGSEILQINNRQALEILNEIANYNEVDGENRTAMLTEAAKYFSYSYFLKFGYEEVFKIKARDTTGQILIYRTYPVDGDTYNINNSSKHYYDVNDIDYDLSINEENGNAIMRITNFELNTDTKMEAFENFCSNSFLLLKRSPAVKNLILDLRDNSGGKLNCCFLLFSYLTKKPFKEYKMVSAKITNVPYQEYLSQGFKNDNLEVLTDQISDDFELKNPNQIIYRDSLNSLWEPQENRFTGNVYVVSNSGVYSAASYLCLLIKNSGRGKIVGEETSSGANESNGFWVLDYTLPHSGIRLYIPFAHLSYSFGKPGGERGCVKPDYLKPNNFESFITNKDNQIQFILDSLILQ